MSPLTRQQLGKLGERLAAEYVRSLGWRVEASRFRVPEGEIDLVCSAPGSTLIFIEVKARRSITFGDTDETVDQRKVARMSRVASAFLRQYNGNGARLSRIRLDVIGFRFSASGDLLHLEHLRDVGF